MGSVGYAVDHFFEYVKRAMTPGLKVPDHYLNAWLHDLIRDWIPYGAIEVTDGEPEVFLQAIIVIIHRVDRKPALLDHKYRLDGIRKQMIAVRRITSILGTGDDVGRLAELMTTYRQEVERWRERERRRN